MLEVFVEQVVYLCFNDRPDFPRPNGVLRGGVAVVGHALDAEDLIEGSYMLEVCSPGVDRTLGREVDFERAVGGKVALETREPVEGRRRFRGDLLSFDAKRACVRTDAGEVTIPFERIARAKSVYPLPIGKR